MIVDSRFTDTPALVDPIDPLATVRDVVEKISSSFGSSQAIQFVLESLHQSVGCESVSWFSTSTKSTVAKVGQPTIDQCSLFSRKLLTALPAVKVCRWINPDSSATDSPTAALVTRSPRSRGCIILATFTPGRRFSEQDEQAALTSLSVLLGFRAHAQLATKKLLTSLIHSLSAVIDAKDPYTAGHSERVARIAVVIGQSMGLSKTNTGDLFLAGLLHDLGKIGIRDEVLWKATKLTEAEFDEIKLHPTIGERIVSGIEPFQRLLPGIRHHHERFDGTGYPDGLAGDSIPVIARILGLSDALDAMMSPRRYRPARSPREIDLIIWQESGKQFDPRVIEAFTAVSDQVYPPIYQKGIGESAFHAIDSIVSGMTETTTPPLQR